MEFKHPKYYKELRKRNKLDQAISLRAHDGERERASDPGLKPQAASSKPQATSSQAASDKLPNPQALIKFQATSIRGLNANKTILRMTYMEGNLVW